MVLLNKSYMNNPYMASPSMTPEEFKQSMIDKYNPKKAKDPNAMYFSPKFEDSTQTIMTDYGPREVTGKKLTGLVQSGAEIAAEKKVADAKEDAFKESGESVPKGKPADLPDPKDPKLTFGQKLNNGLDKVFNMQENNPEAYRKVMSGLDIYLRGQRGDDLATAMLGNSKFNAEQASALIQSSIKANELKSSEMKVLKAEKDLATPDKVEPGELEIAKNIIKKDVNKDDIEAVANFIASRAKMIQLNTGIGFSEAISIAYQLAQEEGGGLKNIASLYGKEFTIDPKGISNVSEADHVKANDEAKVAGQDAYTIGGKTYKVQ